MSSESTTTVRSWLPCWMPVGVRKIMAQYMDHADLLKLEQVDDCFRTVREWEDDRHAQNRRHGIHARYLLNGRDIVVHTIKAFPFAGGGFAAGVEVTHTMPASPEVWLFDDDGSLRARIGCRGIPQQITMVGDTGYFTIATARSRSMESKPYFKYPDGTFYEVDASCDALDRAGWRPMLDHDNLPVFSKPLDLARAETMGIDIEHLPSGRGLVVLGRESGKVTFFDFSAPRREFHDNAFLELEATADGRVIDRRNKMSFAKPTTQGK